ncbi:MAG: hypothetical protein SPH37_03760, partial [Sodaliphilus sp.]|nr:hypothetical protein [Sodaliphilus sp.]
KIKNTDSTQLKIHYHLFFESVKIGLKWIKSVFRFLENNEDGGEEKKLDSGGAIKLFAWSG